MNRIDKAMGHYIALSKYARWLDDTNRRETWGQTVCRFVKYWYQKGLITLDEAFLLWKYTKQRKVMPSMRCLMTAGEALDKDNAAGYNCWAKGIDHVRVFDEIFYLLMCGGGVGFSVERKYVERLPDVPEELSSTDTTIVVPDSRRGWAGSLKQLIAMLYSGDIPRWDLSRIRPAGARLKTFGGRASGPEPLDDLFYYVVRVFQKATGRALTSIECHDIACKIADTVVMGSVRRSACISVSNLTDDYMRRAKMGEWYLSHPERALANNSVGYTSKPDLESYTKECRSIYRSKAGERGIINKKALEAKASECGREYDGEYLLNPCGEAILRDSGQACNLTENVVRPGDTKTELKEKVRVAAIIGTLQCTLTNFRYIRKIWTDNIREERLLGISFTGIMDHPVMSGQEGYDKLAKWLQELKEVARETNILWSNRLGISESKQLTLVKPSGTVSQLCGTSSGIHPRYARHYIRRVTQDIKDPLTDLMIAEGVPHAVDKEKVLFEFPMKSPKHAVLQKDISALEQLELWKIYRTHWCDGNPSQTIYYTDDTFLDVQAWVYRNWDIVGGLSFFPVDDNIYKNAPYEAISVDEYVQRSQRFPNINWERLSEFEHEDGTTSSHELACAGGSCEM